MPDEIDAAEALRAQKRSNAEAARAITAERDGYLKRTEDRLAALKKDRRRIDAELRRLAAPGG